MSIIQKFFKKIQELNNDNRTKYKIINELNTIIRKDVSNMFPKLNVEDTNILSELGLYLHYQIINKFLELDSNSLYLLEQFTQNNNRDIKAIILMLIPFIDDKDNAIKFKKLIDLNQILNSQPGSDNFSSEVGDKNITDTLQNEFYFSNFAIGLLNHEDKYLKLIDDNNIKLIYTIIYHNFIALLETFKIVNGKLYINWMSIEPVIENNLQNENIYKNSIVKVLSREEERDYNGLWIGDFYNVMRNGYYQSIKKVKWLIFNRFNTQEKEPKSQYYLQILDKELDLKNHLDSKSNFSRYNDLPEEEQTKFNKNIKKLKAKIEYNPIIFDLCKQIIIYLVNTYTYKNNIDNDVIKMFTLETDEEDNIKEGAKEDFDKKNLDKLKTISREQVIQIIEDIDPSHIWDYLKEAIDNFQSTIYSTFLINDNDTINHNFYIIEQDKVSTGINLKNLYNIGKLLSYDKTSWTMKYENYIGLSQPEKEEFIKDFTTSDFINFTNNIKIENEGNPYPSTLANVKSSWIKYNKLFVFKYLIRRGLLSKFKPDYKLTNKLYFPQGQTVFKKKYKELMKQKFDNNKEWLDSYYYITNKKFSQLPKERVKDPLVKIKEYNYFEFIAKELEWYRFYTMDWITQLKFFHTYINHQVMYVTGATGQGKSTQVPKLLAYALKMIDYKEEGSVICTQPRIGPTTGNAEWISIEMGVPIKQPSRTISEKTSSNLFYLQYKYQGGSHTTNSNKNLSIKMVTDGTLYEEIKKSQLMKEMIPGKKFSKNKEDFTYSHKNKYDIIIVDEAHEHNPNMDLILTLARNTCYFNNSIRLIIVSATMDDDEPIYRSYYQTINDNLLYPIKQPINLHPFLPEGDGFLPLAIYMDRRFHISPPGETTQYTIT